MNKLANESLVNQEPLLTRGGKIGLAVGAAAVTALYAWSKIDPESIQNMARNALEFVGFHPLFENSVISPQDGGPVMS